MSKKTILRNAVQCRKCGDIIESKNRYKIMTCSCETVSISGGLSFLKRYGSPDLYIELSEFEEEKEEKTEIKEAVPQLA